MSRALAILCVVLWIVLLVASAEIERIMVALPPYMLVIHSALYFAEIFSLLCYCGFAALHSTQRIDSPGERSKWLILTVGMNILGSCIYYCTVYQDFRKKGEGGLLKKW